MFMIIAAVIMALTGGLASTASATVGGNVIEVTDRNYGEVLELSHQKLVVLNFVDESCPLCDRLTDELTQKAEADGGRWTLGVVDRRNAPEVAARFGIRATPTALGVWRGAEVQARRFVLDPPNTVIDVWKWVDMLPLFPRKIDVTTDNYESVIQQSHHYLVVLGFSASPCRPCEMLAPDLAEVLDETSGWTLGKVHVGGWDNPDTLPIAALHDVGVTPVLIPIRNGVEYPDSRFVGYNGNKAALKQWLEAQLAKG